MSKRNLLHLFGRYKFSIIFLVLLFLIFTIFLSQHIHILFATLNVTFIFAFLILVGKVRNKILRIFLISIISLILSVGISFAICFHSPLALGNIASIFETNFAEAISLNISFYLLFLICLLITTTLAFRSISELKWVFSAQRVGIVLFALVLLINVSAIVVPVYRNSSFFSEYKKDIRELPLQTIYAHSAMRSPLLYGDILGLAVYSYEKLDFWRFKNVEKMTPTGVTFANSHEFVPTIYLVIGESAYRGRMSLYGYNLETTPFLDSIARADSSSIHYYNAISIANITRDAVRFSLSFASPQNRDPFWKEENVVELANNADYSTSWLSNQGQAGLYDNYPSYIARSSEHVYFEDKLEKDDLDLLPLLDKYDGKGEKRFTVFHLVGSHFPYNERVDHVDKNTDLPNDYDKSIHHTDRFLRGLYNYTTNKDKSSIIVYLSDHGASPDRGIHGLQNTNRSEYEIPLIILQNNISINVDSIVSQYMDTRSPTINNLNLSYIISQLMGYSVDSPTTNKAIEQGKYIMRTSGEIVPYQTLRH